MRRLIYSIALYLFTPFVAFRLFRKGLKSRVYWQRWSERFIGTPFQFDRNDMVIWLHAVSLGESVAATPLVKKLLAEFPSAKILFTTTTPTGSEHVQKTFADQVFHCYLPYDLPHNVSRFLNRIQPSICVLLELELWPNYLGTLKKRGIPVVMVNARLSKKSMKGYQRLQNLTRDCLRCVDRVLAQSETDAKRFAELGAIVESIEAIGSIKFDLAVPQASIDHGKALRTSLGDRRPVWVAASTHEGEESIVLDVHQRLLECFPALCLIIVPRHPERFERVRFQCAETGLNVVSRSSGGQSESTQILIGDTMGEMMAFYAASDIAFVAGSLQPIGGHNLMEPAALALPVVTGPHLFNFEEMREMLESAGAGVVVDDSDQLFSIVADWLASPAKAKEIGQAGLRLVEKNKGATQHALHQIESYFPPKTKS